MQRRGNNEGRSDVTSPKKITKCPARFIVCCVMSNPKDKGSKITQTTVYCSTFLEVFALRI